MQDPDAPPPEAAMRVYYDRGEEFDRLSSPLGIVESIRTREIIERALVPAPAVIADIGGGPGAYSEWLAQKGYTVEHRDISTVHVEHVRMRAADGVHTTTGDARPLDLLTSRWTRFSSSARCTT
jgi:2-polyprenyl-3-methyl-5-hydroxy-6-metoxy-1,4-benzoquinol methylase